MWISKKKYEADLKDLCERCEHNYWQLNKRIYKLEDDSSFNFLSKKYKIKDALVAVIEHLNLDIEHNPKSENKLICVDKNNKKLNKGK